MILDRDRGEEASCDGLQLIRSNVIYWFVDFEDRNCGTNNLYEQAHHFEYHMFQFPIPLPVGAINVGIILGSLDSLIDLKLHHNSLLHEILRTYLEDRGSIE